MKSIVRNFFLITFSLFIFNACDTGTDQSEDEVDFVSAYVCPMECEGSGSDKPGKCPVCKMQYVSNPKYNADNSSNSMETCSCSMHPNISGQMSDICSICHMALVPITPTRKAPSTTVTDDLEAEDEDEEDFQDLNN